MGDLVKVEVEYELSPENFAHGMSSSRTGLGNSVFTYCWKASTLSWIFLLLATPSVIFLAVCTPPFQSPDEVAHFERSYQISQGGLYGGSGGSVDRGIDESFAPFSQLPFNPNAKVTEADEVAASGVKWTGEEVKHEFSNTATYPPVGYLPQALGVALGRIAGLSVVHTLVLSRLLNGALAIFISTLALYLCQRGKLTMFALLMMPMTLSLFGSCNQDASLISITSLAFALISRHISEGPPLSWRMAVVLASALLIVSLERPPLMMLLLVLLIPGILPGWGGKPAWLTGLSLVGLLAILVLVWWLVAFSSTKVFVNTTPNGIVDARMQAQYMLRHPIVFPEAMIESVHHLPAYAAGIVGDLGWRDTRMPLPYYGVMLLMLLVALSAELICTSTSRSSATVLVLLAVLSSIIGVFLLEYLIWTQVGSGAVDGVQGRYLIPLIIAFSVGLPRLIRSDRGYHLATVVVLLSQLLTFFYLPRVIIERYYLR